MSDVELLDILNELASNENETRQTANVASGILLGGSTDCPVCLEMMVEPTILTTCGHTFCRDCLKEICRREGTRISCPIDRQYCNIPSDGVDGLPMNYALRAMIEEHRHVTADAESLHSLRECKECHSTAILHHCAHCREQLCKECIHLHKDVSTAQLRRLSRQLREGKGRREKSLTQRRSLLAEQQHMCEGVREAVSDFTESLLVKLKEIATKYKQRLFDKIDKHQIWVEEKVAKQIQELTADERYMNECTSRIDTILSQASIAVSDSQIKALDKETSRILQRSLADITAEPTVLNFLIPSDDQYDNVYQQVARLLGVERLTSDLSADNKDAAKQPSVCKSEPDPKSTVPRQEGTDVGGRAAANVHWSTLGKGVGFAAIQFAQPKGLAVSPASRTIYVADCFNHRLQWFNYDALFIRTVGRKGSAAGEFDYPQGLACTPDGHFVISDWDNNRVQVMDSFGAVVGIMGKRGSGAECLSRPIGVAVDNSTGHIYVCDTNNHRVQIITATGEFIGHFRSRASEGQFNGLAGIAVAQGRVVVADRGNNRLQVFTTAGEHTRTITGDHVKEPCGVAMNQAGNKVYVCCETGIVVYQLSPTVELEKQIPFSEATVRPLWITLLSESEALVTLESINVVHLIRVN